MAARPRGARLAALGLGAAGIGAAAAAAAPPAGEAGAPGATVAVKERDERARYRERIAVRGAVSSKAAGRRVALQYAPRGREYRTVKHTTSGEGGRYAVSLRPHRSGSLRVVADGRPSAAQEIEVAARVSANGREHLRRGRVGLVRGRVRPGDRGRRVYMQVSRVGVRDGWHTVDRGKTRRGGRFRTAWRPDRSGTYRVRVRFLGDRRNRRSRRTLDERINVYRPAHASWYGPGFYGNRTACGRTLTRGTLGVAHRSLRCGRDVTLRYRGRTVRVPVIDRGPYAAGREFDLTAATKRRLRFGSTGRIWAAS